MLSTLSSPIRASDYAITDDGCWIWQGRVFQGYGFTKDRKRAHRVSYEQHVGDISEGHHVHHECRNKACINPGHLSALDPKAHLREHRMGEKGLTPDDYWEIRRLIEACELSYPEIGAMYGLHENTVYEIRAGVSWPEYGLTEPVQFKGRVCAMRFCSNSIDHKRHQAKYCSRTCRSYENGWKAGTRSPRPSRWLKDVA